ncbi:uncharacterized protein MONBRDRAFT_33951 [Monosiga brevicollis MX1]|uniref:60S ribosomal protein L32 n=1 Tax=Monosiga brevicollis TaxID=81824 RepID=A9V8P8_MONBE|nr:uncharacterized protein MONBRDRAFT_33951 [Monosiga brevicollis MX1]EDQ86123.1 predicted protein [Monosiga brevicollis MX1]|eukprot:XP_001749048.1 hypothetical protein [Monosiga brevicollis MX1]
MVMPANRRKIVKKRTKAFKRMHWDRYKCVDPSWRKPHGIDGRFRRRFHGLQKHPKIGYGSNQQTRHMMPDGFKKFLVRAPEDLEVLLMHNRTYAAELAHNLSARTRRELVTRAAQLNVKLTNGGARVRSEESE